MTAWTEVTNQVTSFTETGNVTQRYKPVGLVLRITTQDDRKLLKEDSLSYLIIENRIEDITEVGDQSSSYTENADQSTSYTEVADQ